MTTASEPNPRPIVTWLAHREARLLVVVTVLWGACDVWPTQWWSWIASFGGMIILFASLWTSGRHAYRFLCVRCAASTPLDPQGAAEQRDRWLRWHHAVQGSRLVSWLALAFLLIPPIISWTSPWTHVNLWWANAPGLTLILFWAFEARLTALHRPVQPWCPYCHWDDEGDEEEVPATPDPVSSGEKT